MPSDGRSSWVKVTERRMATSSVAYTKSSIWQSKYGLEMSSKAYTNWNFTELALPADLIKRSVARGDPKSPEKLELLIKDYPYAVDGLDMWMAIKKWVCDYCTIYYANDGAVTSDNELQAWWTEVRHVGHVDLKDAH
ncbi:unnamed protein product [Urochloa humidicola]